MEKNEMQPQQLAPQPELLVPAGDMERLGSALQYGANAVYLAGKQFGMRAAPQNFDEAGLREAARLCHAKGVKLYVTCNTIPHNEELALMPAFLQECAAIPVDGLIIADLGVLAMAKMYAPQVDIHISTQAGVANYQAARAFYDLGAKRVVLARELSCNEILEIRKNTPKDLEIEVFVHGAMCMSFSGRCLLSSYMTGRDANRGDCAQPCRWEYELTEKKRPGEYFSIAEEVGEHGLGSTYIMNSKDLCLIDQIPLLLAAGVTSLKIEGRAKSAYYVASVTAAYRGAIDFVLQNPNQPLPQWVLAETERISHRAYSKGFFAGGEPGQTTDTGGYIRTWDVIALCIERQGEYVKLAQRNRFFAGETAEVLEPGKPPYTLVLQALYDERFAPITVAPHAAQTVYLKTPTAIAAGAYLRVQRQGV